MKRVKERLALWPFLVIGMIFYLIMNQCSAQVPGNKKIVISCKDSNEALYKRVGLYLVSNGYSIENSSPEFQSLRTAPKNTSRWNLAYNINVVVVDSLITITAGWRVNTNTITRAAPTSFNDWEFKNTKMSTAQGIVYNDLVNSLRDFDRIKMEFR